MGGVGAVFSAAGSGFQSLGNYQDSVEAERAMRRNAAMSKLASSDARMRGNHESAKIRTQGTDVLAEQKLAFGAGNTGGAAPIDLMASTELYADADATTAMNNAVREAWGLKVKAAQQLDDARREYRRRNNLLGASMLGGASGASRYYQE